MALKGGEIFSFVGLLGVELLLGENPGTESMNSLMWNLKNSEAHSLRGCRDGASSPRVPVSHSFTPRFLTLVPENGSCDVTFGDVMLQGVQEIQGGV